MDWSLREGYAWAEDKEHCEEYGRMLTANPSKVIHMFFCSQRERLSGSKFCARMLHTLLFVFIIICFFRFGVSNVLICIFLFIYFLNLLFIPPSPVR